MSIVKSAVQALLSMGKLSAKQKIVSILVLIATIIVGRNLFSSDTSDSLPYTVKRENLVDSILTSGNVIPAAQTIVYSPATGIIDELFVQNGQYVKENDPLFSVKSTATETERAQALAIYQSALNAQKVAEQNKQLYDAQMWAKRQAIIEAQNTRNYQRDNKTNPSTGKDYTELEKLAIENALTQTEKDFVASEKKYKEADAALNAAYAQTKVASLSMKATQSTEVKAQIGGTITNLGRTQGESVIAGPSAPGTVNPSSPILTIATIDPMRVQVKINEGDISRVKQGQEALITFDGIKDKEFKGIVTVLDTIGTNNQGIITYNAYLEIIDAEPTIRPQMTANVRIITMKKNDVLLVPNSALIDKGGMKYIIDSKTKRHIRVELGVKGITKTEITSGLPEGTLVVSDASLNNE